MTPSWRYRTSSQVAATCTGNTATVVTAMTQNLLSGRRMASMKFTGSMYMLIVPVSSDSSPGRPNATSSCALKTYTGARSTATARRMSHERCR
nr:unnamed protein product [Digitaria exilis]